MEEPFDGALPTLQYKSTDNRDEYIAAWEEFYTPLLNELKELNLLVIGFDPTVLYGVNAPGSFSFSLPKSVQLALNKRIHELNRLREFYQQVVEGIEQYRPLDAVKEAIREVNAHTSELGE